jgi:teichuronic acid biosynthesis glycosyltransferase TuaC
LRATPRFRTLLSWERHHDGKATALIVTNGWPHPEHPAYCVFVARQVDSLIDEGLACDVLFIRGYRSVWAYAAAAATFLWWSLTGRRPYSVVHAHGGETAVAARFYLRAPVVASYLGEDVLGRPNANGVVPLSNRLKRWAIKQHSRTLSRTLTKTAEMESVLPASVRTRNEVVPNGVDRQIFRPNSRDDSRAQLGWSQAAPIILFAAKPEDARKRFHLLEAALPAIREIYPGARVEIAARVSPSVVPVMMNAADCLVLASSSEGSPNVVKEALMCNLPVISTRVGDVESLLAGVTPSYIVRDEPEAIAQAVIDCIRLGARSNGREVAANLASEIVARQVLRFYEAAGAVVASPSVKRAVA